MIMHKNQIRHHDSVTEWLRWWTRNPLGSARRGSNPLAVGGSTCAAIFTSGCSSEAVRRSIQCAICPIDTCPAANYGQREKYMMMRKNQIHHHDSVTEWLRWWTRNPLGSARRGSNPLAVGRSSHAVIFTSGWSHRKSSHFGKILEMKIYFLW